MSFGREQQTVPVFFIICLDVVDDSTAQQHVTLVHFDTKGAENLIRLLGMLHYGILPLFVFIGGGWHHGKIMMYELRIFAEFHHFRVYEHEFEL